MAKFFTGLLLGDFESDVQQCKACQGEIDKDDEACHLIMFGSGGCAGRRCRGHDGVHH